MIQRKVGTEFRWLLVTWLLLALLSGCAAPTSQDPTVAHDRLVLLWHPFADARQDALLALGDRFNAEHSARLTLVVEYQPNMTTLLSTMAPEQRPDLMIVLPQDLPSYTAQDFTPVPLEDLPDDLLPMGRELFTVNGVLQALPLGLATYVLYTNDNWLRDIGYTPASAILEDLRLSTCRATDLASGQVGLGISGQPGVLLALLAAGEASIIGDDGYVHFDDPAGTRVGAVIKEGVRASCIRSFAIPGDAVAQFSDSTMAMLIESSMNRRAIEATVKAESNFTLGLAGLPGPVGPGPTLWYGIGIMSTQSSGPRYDAAQTVLEWLLEPETQLEWAERTEYLPVRVSGLEAQLAALPDNAGIKQDLLQLTLSVAEGGAWAIWPVQAHNRNCRAALVQALTSLNSELPAHEALQNAAAVCNAELIP